MVNMRSGKGLRWPTFGAMPSVVPDSGLPQDQQHQLPQLHMPRLSYRKHSFDESSLTLLGSVGSVSPTDTVQTGETSPTQPSRLSSDLSPMRSPKLPSGTPSPGSESVSTSARSSSAPTKASKKTSSSLFGFLSVKEPSTQALLDYQEHLRKQAQTQNGRLTAVGMPGVSSAKLPTTVPKVNSRWDGIPQAAKGREKVKGTSKRQSATSVGRSWIASLSGTNHAVSAQPRGSISSVSSQGSQANRDTGSSIFSSNRASQSSIGTRSGWENASISSGSDTKDFARSTHSLSLRSPSTTALSESASLFPPDGITPPPICDAEQAESSTGEKLSSGLSSHNVTPPLPSGISTKSAPLKSPLSVTATACEITAASQRRENTSETTATPSSRYETRVTIKSAGTDVLGPPATARKRAKAQPFLFDETECFEVMEAQQQQSILQCEPPAPESEAPARPRLDSYFPDVTAETSGRPHQRLGSAMHTREKDVAPWESLGTKENVAQKEPVQGPTSQHGRGLLRRSRMALFSKSAS